MAAQRNDAVSLASVTVVVTVVAIPGRGGKEEGSEGAARWHVAWTRLRAAQPHVGALDVRGIPLDVDGPHGREDILNAAEQLIAEAERRSLEGLRGAIAAASSARGLLLSEVGRSRLASCTDVDILTRWLVRTHIDGCLRRSAEMTRACS